MFISGRTPVLVVDVVGYSQLMGEDEAGTRARFNAHLHKLIEPAIARGRGRIVKTTGDEHVQQEALVGSRTVLDVLDAEQELLDASVSLVRAERDEVVAAYQLRSAVGRLTAESLNLPVKKYDFTKNYRRVRNKWFGLSIDK